MQSLDGAALEAGVARGEVSTDYCGAQRGQSSSGPRIWPHEGQASSRSSGADSWYSALLMAVEPIAAAAAAADVAGTRIQYSSTPATRLGPVASRITSSQGTFAARRVARAPRASVSSTKPISSTIAEASRAGM